MFLIAITQKLLGVIYSFQLTIYWIFEGANLRDIYDKTYFLED